MDTTTFHAPDAGASKNHSRRRRHSRLFTTGALITGALVGASGLAAVRAAGSGGEPSVVVPLSPERILDTRAGIGRLAPGPVGPDQTITLQVAGVGSIPPAATGVVLNITATDATEASYVTAWPTGDAQSTTSILNFRAGADIANMITATLGDSGAINLYNYTGTVHLVGDVAGYLLPTAGTGTALQGPPGPAGAQGVPGPQGPGAIVVNGILQEGSGTQSLGTIDAFTISATCSSVFHDANFVITPTAGVLSFHGFRSGQNPTEVLRDDGVNDFSAYTAAHSSTSGLLWLSSTGSFFAVDIEMTWSNGTCFFWAQFTPGKPI